MLQEIAPEISVMPFEIDLIHRFTSSGAPFTRYCATGAAMGAVMTVGVAVPAMNAFKE